MSSGPPTPRAFLHIGAPKTGSTFLQGMLWSNRESLRTSGVAVPGVGAFEHFRASRDLRGGPFDPDEPGGIGTGAWDLLAQKVGHRHEPVVVISDEQLAALDEAQVERAVASLSQREVHVIYVVRELTSLLPSSWQEVVKHRSTRPYRAWARSVLQGRGRGFWRVQDVPAVLQRWGSVIPPQRQHVITMPQRGAGVDELWRRFASVLGVDAAVAERADVSSNRSLSFAATEVLRQVNAELPPSFERWQYTTLVQEVLAAQVLSGAAAAPPPPLPHQLRQLAADQQARIIAGIKASGCEVVGALDDLRPDSASTPAPSPSDAELFVTAVRGISGLLLEMARRQELARQAPSTRLLEALVRRESVGRVVTALEGRSAQLDAVLIDRARVARERIRGKTPR